MKNKGMRNEETTKWGPEVRSCKLHENALEFICI